MKAAAFSLAAIIGLFVIPVVTQTYSTCNPLRSGSCPADTALGKSVAIDFTSGPSDSFTPQGSPSYSSNGASFTVAKSGDSPQLTSKWYIMFGHVDFVLKPAPGAGIVSSAVLQSDDLDEIDWEWLGSDNNQVQSNYFGKGQITSYDRGAFHADPSNQGSFKKYSIDWTANSISWQIDGTTVRTLTPETASGQYPQTPMMIKIGAWSGGDPANAQGTIAWAGGPTNYANGPFTMQVKSISATDYSTGTQYTYSGTSGTWDSIQAAGGKVNAGEGKGVVPVMAAPPTVTPSSNTAPMPFEGTHRDTTSTYVTPDIYPWVPTTLQKSPVATVTTYPGLPSGWTVTNDGKVLPPSAAPSTPQPVLSISSPSALPPGSPTITVGGGHEVITKYDDRGFLTTITQAAAAATLAKHFDEQGFLVTPSPDLGPGAPSPTKVLLAADSASQTTQVKKITITTAAANTIRLDRTLGAACGILLGGVLAM